jgi:putative ABC transport system permease protein
VVVSHGLWARRLGGDETAVGRPIRLDGTDYTLVGVLPREVGPLEHKKEFFAAAQWATPSRKGPFFITAVGRLRRDVGRAAAEAELRAINQRIFPLWQASYQDRKATWAAMDLKEYVVGNVGTILLVVLGAVGFVLLIACTNAANLLVARATHRGRELAVRSALGASRGRLLQHLLSESVVLALGAALLGLALAALGIRLATTLGADYLPRTQEIGLHRPVLAFLAAITVGGGLLFGLVPSLHGLSARLDRALGSGGRSATDAVGPRRLRRALVVAQFAVATPLLIAAGLLTASLARLERVDPGFDGRGVISAGLFLPAGSYPDTAVPGFWVQARTRVESLPGVRSVAFSNARPPNEVPDINNFDLEDHPTPLGQSQPALPFVTATPEYFQVLGLRLVRGRLFDERDAEAQAPPVVVVDQAWADRFFPGQDPVGRRFRAGGCTTCPWTTVVGVVSAVKYSGLDHPDQGTVYVPMPSGLRSRYFVARTSVDPGSVLPSLRQAVRDLDPRLPLTNVATLEELRADSLEVPRYLSVLVGAFASVALLLSVVGVYGVMSYFVQQQLRDIGIRMALGAQPSSVVRMVVGHGMRVVALGVLAGIGGGLALTRFLSSLLFEVAATDTRTFAAVSTLMLVVALLACLLPARRAAGVDPARILRQD